MTSFAAIVPFADFIVDPELKNVNKFTEFIVSIFYSLDLDLNYLNFSILLVVLLFLPLYFLR